NVHNYTLTSIYKPKEISLLNLLILEILSVEVYARLFEDVRYIIHLCFPNYWMKVRVIYDFSAQWSGELSVSIGEELTITNQNVGSGWWQAVNAFGKEGLIPSEFVEIIELPEPTAPPPSLPPTEFGKEIDRFDEWDDEWDSDENDTATLNKNLNDRSQQVVSKQTDSSISVPNNPDYIRTTLIRKFFPRSFIRNGGEDFLLGHDPPPFPQTEANIDLIDDTFRWRYVSSDLTSCISSFRKDSKMKGIKSFIAYQITNSVRATKCPPHQACTTEPLGESRGGVGRKWKLGKREAETDKLQGGRFYFAVETKSGHTSQDYTVEKAEAAERFLSDLDRSTKFLSETVNEYHRKLSTSIRKEFSTLSLAFLNMSKAIESDVHTIAACTLVSEASINLQECLKEFTRLLPSTSNIISLAKAACLTVDELNRVSNNNSADEQKYSQSDVNRIQSGALIITRSVQAECNHIMSQIRNEWMNKIKDYLHEQARFYHQIAELIEKSAQSFQVN
ncbi:Sorting nexin-9, partial [Schistosoma japonicum]